MTHESHEQRAHEHHQQHPQHEDKDPGAVWTFHPAWWIVLGVALTGLAVLTWIIIASYA